MSKALSNLLEHPEKMITKIVSELEDKNGYPSHDVRATSDNIQKLRRKISELNLDPDDTTGPELYHALLLKFENDARRFDEHFGLYAAGFDDKIQKAVELVSKNTALPERWVLKSTAAKKLLKQHPPKKLMKQLNYRSVESLAKREDLAEVYLATEAVESSTWKKAHFKLASQLDTTAFERRALKLQALTSRWGSWEADDLYVASSDYGVLGLLPTEEVQSMNLLSLVVLLLEEVGAKPSDAAKLSSVVAWWSETDAVIANLGGDPVSLNLKDVALNQTNALQIGEHQRTAGQQSLWKELVSRYENQIPAAEDILPRLVSPIINIKAPLNQPAFEYAEDI